MSNRPAQPTVSGNVIALCVTAMFVVVVIAVVVAALAVSDGARLTTIVTLLLGSLAGLPALLVTVVFAKRTLGHVEDLSNGVGDAKFRAAIADVIDPQFLRADVHDQLQRDRAVRQAKAEQVGR